MTIETIIGFVAGGTAGSTARCPLGDDDCPILKFAARFIFGAAAAVGYFFLVLHGKAPKSIDMIAIMLFSYFFAYFIGRLIAGKKQPSKSE